MKLWFSVSQVSIYKNYEDYLITERPHMVIYSQSANTPRQSAGTPRQHGTIYFWEYFIFPRNCTVQKNIIVKYQKSAR